MFLLIIIFTIYMNTCVFNHMCNCFAWLLEAVLYSDFTTVMRVLSTVLCGKITVSSRLLRVCNERVCEVSGVSPSRSARVSDSLSVRWLWLTSTDTSAQAQVSRLEHLWGPLIRAGACQSWWCPAESFPDGPGCRRTDGFTPRLLTACHQLQPHCTPCSSACLYLLLSCCGLFSSVPMNENISLSHTSHPSAEGLWHASNTRQDWEKFCCSDIDGIFFFYVHNFCLFYWLDNEMTQACIVSHISEHVHWTLKFFIFRSYHVLEWFRLKGTNKNHTYIWLWVLYFIFWQKPNGILSLANFWPT